MLSAPHGFLVESLDRNPGLSIWLLFARTALNWDHLALSRTTRTIDGAAKILPRFAYRRTKPLVENIATLLDPPGSVFSESAWISGILNLPAAACFWIAQSMQWVQPRLRSAEFLQQIPAASISTIHNCWRKNLFCSRRHASPS